VHTEFLERRELQLIEEAETYPPDSSQNRHLLGLSQRLWNAILALEMVATDPALLGAHVALNPWHNRTDLTAHGIKLLS
jgi:hypothetical protein